MERQEVSALIPAYNEAERIGDTVRAIKAIPDVCEVIVVNDGSTDLTGPRAIEAGAFMIQLERNRGKGNAVNVGLEYVHHGIVLLVDGDLGKSAKMARYLLEPLLMGEADLVIAAFPKGEPKSGFGFVEGFARWVIRRFGGLKTQSPLSGQRAIRTALLRELGGVAPGFGMEVAMTLAALRYGGKVLEVEVPMSHRKTGRNLVGFLHRGEQLLHIITALWFVHRHRVSPKAIDKTQGAGDQQDLEEGQPSCN